MASLAELTALRASLVEARAMGVRRVRDSDGSEVEYKSDSEMARAVAALDAEIRAASKPPPNTIHFRTSKGI